MSPLWNYRNSFPNPERPNLPSPTLITHLGGTPLPPGPVPLTCPLVANPLHYGHIPEALPLHPALLPALPQRPLTRLPSALPHTRFPKGPNPRTSEERDSPLRTTHSVWSLVRISKHMYMQIKMWLNVFEPPLMDCMQLLH